MKKVLIVICILLFFGVIGCDNEIKNNIENKDEINNNEIIEEKKYLTIELKIETVSKKTVTGNEEFISYNTNVLESNIKNDENNIFKDLMVVDKTYDEAYKEIQKIAEINSLTPISNYNHLISTTDINTTTIIFKPTEQIEKYNGKINLNDNIVVVDTLTSYSKMTKSCADALLSYDYGINHYNLSNDDIYRVANGDGINCYFRTIDESLIKEFEKLSWHKVLGKGEELITRGEAGDVILENVFVSRIVPLGVWFEDIDEFNLNSYQRTMLEKYNVQTTINWYRDFRDGYIRFNYQDKYNRNFSTLGEIKDYYILDEQICKEYNLICDRW